MNNNINEQVLSIQNLKYAYQKGQATILDIPSWFMEKGKSVFLYGESGSGKSTLLNLLSGMLVSKNGDITVAGTRLHTLSARQRDRFRAQHIGVVFQQFNLIPYLSVIDNILLAANFASGLSADIEKKALSLLEQVNLPKSVYRQKATSLSIGQQQRVAIVRALLNSPDILLVDEPTSALDAGNRDAFIRLLLDVVEHENISLVFVSHDLSLSNHFDEKVSLSSINKASVNHAGSSKEGAI